MKVSLDIAKQNALLNAYSKLDGKLGAHRRGVVRNMNALRASLEAYEETRKAIFVETWPDKNPLVGLTRDEDPENFDKFKAVIDKVTAEKDEFDLVTLPASVVYGEENEFPLVALAAIEEHGLVEG